MKHCCENMTFFLNEDKISINYSVKDREYSINLKYSDAIQLIFNCPWCGSKLPKGLSDEWLQILEDEYSIKFPFNEDKDKVPKEFYTDAWWKKRGL